MAGGGNLRSWVLLSAVLAALVRLVLFPSNGTFPRDRANRLQAAEIQVTPEFLGPESLAFDAHGRGPYTGVGDGRVVRWDGLEKGWSDFAITSPNRTEVCNPKRPLVMDLSKEPLCGRPLGLRFDQNGDLYIADAYYGLLRVGKQGGLANSLASEAEGVPLGFTNDVDFGGDGLLYFTDSSTNYQKRHFVLMFLHGDDSGRLLTYDPATKEIKVALRGLHFPNGIAISKDKSFLLICETLTRRILRYWLRGQKAGKLERFAELPGYPDNIRLTERGDFWVAVHAQQNWVLKLPVAVRRALLKLPISFASWYINMARTRAMGMVIRLGAEGEVLEVLEDREGKVVKLVSGLEERDGKLWLGSVVLPQIAHYQLLNS